VALPPSVTSPAIVPARVEDDEKATQGAPSHGLRKFYVGAAYVFAMASILEHRNVNVPLVRAAGYLRRYVREIFATHKGLLTLSVASPTRRNGSRVELQEDVIVDFAKMVHLKLLTGETAVVWRPVHGGGMIPSFTGRLSFAAAESAESCQLSLDGTYTPPLGVVGAAFDVVFGHAIARATAQRLLKSIAQDVEIMHRDASTKTAPAYRERWGSS
jgi:hypothetical protein